MRKHSTLLSFILCLLFLNPAVSQITSTSGPLHLCVPASVTYTAPSGASNITWNFGPHGASTLTTGGFNVGSPSNFTATFNGIVNGNNTTFSVPVFVHAKPTASFSINQPANTCIVKTVTITDLSTGPSPIQTWNWAYGDGGSSITSSSIHTYGYSLAGTYSITLHITDIYGCDNQITTGTIITTNPPQAVISSNPAQLVSCSSNLSASFSASNSVGSNLTYNWNFGNSQTSQLQSPGPINFVSQANPYIITLTVSSGGCSSTVSTMASVSAPTLSVNILADTICLNGLWGAIINTNQSSTLWNFGTSSTVFATPVSQPTVVNLPPLSSYGVHTIVITAGTAPCMAPAVTKTVLVEQVTANYSVTPGAYTACAGPLSGTFTNLSSSNFVNYLWVYNNWQGQLVGTNANNPNPTIYFNVHSNNPYTIFPSYTVNVTLSGYTSHLCNASFSMPYHIIEKPTAFYSRNKTEGCAPLAVTFTSTSNFFFADPVASYTWCNGAIPQLTVAGTGTIPVQTFTYATAGSYTPYLIVQTVNGCIDTSFIDTITAANPPNVSFSFNPSQVCWNQPVQITNTTPNYAAIPHWHVESDNGFFSSCVNDPNPSWNFTHVGLHTFTLSGYQNSCKGSAVSTQSLLVKGPIVSGRFETNCDVNRKSVNFYALLQECQNATLNFGDGTPTNSLTNLSGNVSYSTTHVYANTGDYTVTLTGYNSVTNCGPHTFTMQVKVRNIQALFTFPQPTVCVNSAVGFNAAGSVDVYMPPCGPLERKFLWYFDNGIPVNTQAPAIGQSFNSIGVHTVSLYVKDENSCTSTLSKTIGVSGPAISFTFNPSPICLSNGTVQIINNSSNLPDPIVGYTWDFGNGQPLYNTTSTAPLTQTYTSANTPFSTYSIVLTATNSIGCVDSKMQVLQVNKPDASFNPTPQNICIPGTAPFTVTFTTLYSFPSYTYHFGTAPNASMVSTSSVVSYPYTPGTYTVSVSVKDAQGCASQVTKVINATQTPTADFIYSSAGSTKNNVICSPGSASFTNISIPQPNNYPPNWDFGLGFGSVLPLNVVPFPFNQTVTTVIPLSLMVNTGPPNYCQSTATRNFTVYVAKAKVVLSNTTACLGAALKLSIDTANGGGVNSWVWDYGDLSFSPTVTANSSPPSFTMHTYNTYPTTTAGNATVSLIYYSSQDACRYYDGIPIKIRKVDANFKRNDEIQKTDSIHCLKIPDTFKNVTFSTNSPNLIYDWRFPFGGVGTGTAPTYVFPKTGVHQVSLTVTDAESGCIGKAVKSMTILALPTASISTGLYCPDRPFPITASLSPGAVSGTWSPTSAMVESPTFTTLTGVFTSTAIISNSGDFYLQVTDTNNCVSDTARKFINIVPPPPVERWDTTVIIGETIPINGFAGNFTYTWSPVTANLNCTTCANPLSTTTVDITYNLLVEDLMKCAVATSTYNIIIKPKTSVDVPTAFTPNGDGTNDVIYVDGWGIRKLKYFRIYNRWGQLLFESNDLSIGWDGTYNGVPQNMETYVYQVAVETWIEGRDLEKTSTFKLLR